MMCISKSCPTCGEKLTHKTVYNFEWCWWECDICGYLNPVSVPLGVLESHRKAFRYKQNGGQLRY